MKKLFLLILISSAAFKSQAQYDSTKPRQFISANGYDYKNLKAINSLVLPTDTIQLAVRDSGSVAWLNGVVYTWDGSKWGGSKAGLDSNSVRTIVSDSLISKPDYADNITALENYTGRSNSVIVRDSLRGGTFTYVASATPDSGTVFPRSGGGYWQRVYEGDINAKWFGLPTDSTTDARAVLMQVFTVANGKKVVFPANKTYFLSSQIQMILNNSQINFNNCTFKIDNTWSQSWILSLHNSTNTTLTNLNINGNKSVVSLSKSVMGLYIDSTKNCYIDNTHFYDIDYHALWVSTGNTGLSFGLTKYDNNYGASASSDVYLSFDSTGNCSFNTIVSNRDSYQAGQVVYNDANNTDIKTIYANNASVVIAYRVGKHTLGDVYATNCGSLLFVQSDAGTNINNPSSFPSVHVHSLTGYNVKGDASTVSAIYINLCNNFIIDQANISFDTTSSNRWYGVRVSEASAPSSVRKLSLNNIKVLYPSVAAYYFQKNTQPIYCTNLSAICKGVQGLRSDSALNYIYVPHSAMDSANFPKYIASGADMFIYANPLRRNVMTVQQLIDGVWTDMYTDSTQITQNGTTGYLQKTTGSKTLGNSVIYDDGTNAAIGTITMHTKFNLAGTNNIGALIWQTNPLSSSLQSQIQLVNGTTWFGANDRSYQILNNGINSTSSEFTIQYWDGTTYNKRFNISPLGILNFYNKAVYSYNPTFGAGDSLALINKKYGDSALALKASLLSPALGGTPTAPTADTSVNNQQLATTAFAHALMVASNIYFQAPLVYNSSTKTVYLDSTATIRTAKIRGNGSAPTVTIGADFTGTVSVTGTDLAGEITINLSAATSYATLDPIVSLTFNSAYTTTPYVVFSPSSASAGDPTSFGGVYLKTTSTTGFTLATVGSGTSVTTIYKYTYHVMQ